MKLILDTDHLTVIQRETEPEYSQLRAKLRPFSPDSVCTTIVSFEEQMRGWLSLIARARKSKQEVAAYQRLQSMLTFFSGIPVLDYNRAASEQFVALRRLCPRVGSMDLKIAAIAISSNATLLSRNTKDFQVVPNLKVEDWTK